MHYPHVFGLVLAESPSLWIAEGRFLQVRPGPTRVLARLPALRIAASPSLKDQAAPRRPCASAAHGACRAVPSAPPTRLPRARPSRPQDMRMHRGMLPERLFLACGTKEYSATRDHERCDVDALLHNYCSQAADILQEQVGRRAGRASCEAPPCVAVLWARGTGGSLAGGKALHVPWDRPVSGREVAVL
jgi:hypothetical protein